VRHRGATRVGEIEVPRMPRSILMSLVVLAACFDNPPDADGEGSSSGDGSSGPGTSAATGTSASTSDASGPDGSGSASSEASGSGSSDDTTTGAPACALSGTWENVLDDEGESGMGAQGRGMEVADDGTVYITGNIDGHWLVRRSSDRGSSWDGVDDYTGEGGVNSPATPGGVAFAADGTVFVSGVLGGEVGQSSSRIVRRSADGATWSTVENFQLEFGFDTFASGIAVASDGTVFTAGHADSSQGGRWIVRRSDDGGDSWVTDDDFQQFDGVLCLPRDIVAVADGTMLASGHCFQDPDFMGSLWTVRRRTARGWTTVDQQGMDQGFGDQGAANGAFSSSRSFVAGAVIDVTDSHWTIRVSDDGTTWSTLDDWTSPAGGARAVAILDHGDGTLLALGSETGTVPTTVTRRSDDEGASWETIETYTYVQGLYGGPLVMSPNGDVYTGAIALADGGINHWLVRRMSCD
jgi:hypothetical protein